MVCIYIMLLFAMSSFSQKMNDKFINEIRLFSPHNALLYWSWKKHLPGYNEKKPKLILWNMYEALDSSEKLFDLCK